MVRPLLFATIMAVPFAVGCVFGGHPYLPSAEEIPALEDRVDRSPEDAQALTRLGAAYHRAGRIEEASAHLERARSLDPDDPLTAFFLGAVYETRQEYQSAVSEYQRSLNDLPRSGFTRELEARIQGLRFELLREAVRVTVAREQELAQIPNPNTLAVFPFNVGDAHERMRPLGRAIAEMLSTDLAQTDRLTVLERIQVQALLSEVALNATALVDRQSAVRGGRLLGAGRIVRGQVSGDSANLTIEVAVADLSNSRGISPISRRSSALELFETEKDLAFGIFEAVGIPLSEAERQRVSRRFTGNLQALLAFGRGLDAVDERDYAEAVRHFAEAVNLDSGFEEARQRGAEATEASQGSSTNTVSLAEEAVRAVRDVIIADQIEALSREVMRRDPAQEALGTEGVAGGAPSLVSIILRRPGGGN